METSTKDNINVAFLLQKLIIPHSQPWKLDEYNRLCQACPLLKGQLSLKATCTEWSKAGADQIVKYLISKNRVDNV